jgi:hypothetical protein
VPQERVFSGRITASRFRGAHFAGEPGFLSALDRLDFAAARGPAIAAATISEPKAPTLNREE